MTYYPVVNSYFLYSFCIVQVAMQGVLAASFIDSFNFCEHTPSGHSNKRSNSTLLENLHRLSRDGAQNLTQSSGGCRYPTSQDKNYYICDSYGQVELYGKDLPYKLDGFLLRGTQVSTLRNRTFANKFIRIIFMERNPITTIEEDAFIELEGLQELHLRNNAIRVPAARTNSFFAPFRTLHELESLALDDNEIRLSYQSMYDGQKQQNPLLPCLTKLTFDGNPLGRVERELFKPLAFSPIRYLSFKNCQLTQVENDSYIYLNNLESLILENNPEYLVGLQSTYPRGGLGLVNRNFKFLDLKANLLKQIPDNVLFEVSDILIKLDLSSNYLYCLPGSANQSLDKLCLKSFPFLPLLETLILDSCNIHYILDGAFQNLPSLKVLSMKKNPLPQIPAAVILPNLQTLYMEGYNDEAAYNLLAFPQGIFQNSSNLRNLVLNKYNFNPLKSGTFQGLENLTALSLDKSLINHLGSDVFLELTGLKLLSLRYIIGLEHTVPLCYFLGLEELEYLDLMGTPVLDEQNNMLTNLCHQPKLNEKNSCLYHLKELDLTSSLLNRYNHFDCRLLFKMPNLQILSIGRNKISGWNCTLFETNSKLSQLEMNQNKGTIHLTQAMLGDFKKLSKLDLSNNEFTCNEYVAKFYKMLEEPKDDVLKSYTVGWKAGKGYACEKDDGSKVSFEDFARTGVKLGSGYGHYFNDSPKGVWRGLEVYQIFIIGGSIPLIIISVFVFGNIIHKHWWFIQFLIAKRKSQNRSMLTRLSGKSFVFDAFISYFHEERSWVEHELVEGLENTHGKVLCIDERDFHVGVSTIENIVLCLEQSSKCIIVLTESYAKSDWSMFEAQVAQNMFKNDGRQILVVIPHKLKALKTPLKYVLKTNTCLEWKENHSCNVERILHFLNHHADVACHSKE